MFICNSVPYGVFSLDHPECHRRLEYFWPSSEFSDRVLFNIAHDVPKAENPLLPSDLNEVFPGDEPSKEHLDQASDDSLDAAVTQKKERKRRVKLRPESTRPKCVEWLGLVNEKNGFAAIKLSMPGKKEFFSQQEFLSRFRLFLATFENWITWTNRIIVFLFANIDTYEVPEDFVRLLNPPLNGPFRMKCRNPR